MVVVGGERCFGCRWLGPERWDDLPYGNYHTQPHWYTQSYGVASRILPVWLSVARYRSLVILFYSVGFQARDNRANCVSCVHSFLDIN